MVACCRWGTCRRRCSSTAWARLWPASTLRVFSTAIATSASRRCPLHRARVRPTAATPGTAAAVRSIKSKVPSSTPSMSRRTTVRIDPTSTAMITAAMARPITGSTHGSPNQAPMTPSTTAREVRASVRACWPSAISAAEPMRRPARMR